MKELIMLSLTYVVAICCLLKISFLVGFTNYETETNTMHDLYYISHLVLVFLLLVWTRNYRLGLNLFRTNSFFVLTSFKVFLLFSGGYKMGILARKWVDTFHYSVQYVLHNMFLKLQSCKICNSKYMIVSTQITNTEIFTFIAVLVFKLLICTTLFINRKDNRSC